jgi:hypothetical protein
LSNLRILQFYYFNITIEGDQYLHWRGRILLFCSSRLPEDGTAMPKHVEFDTCHALYFMIFILRSELVVDILNYISMTETVSSLKTRQLPNTSLRVTLSNYHTSFSAK